MTSHLIVMTPHIVVVTSSHDVKCDVTHDVKCDVTHDENRFNKARCRDSSMLRDKYKNVIVR